MKQDLNVQITTVINKKREISIMATGKVKWYNDAKGYGFIETKEGQDVFVHRSGLSVSYLGLEPGQTVEFQTKNGEKGLVAFDVKLIK